MSPGPGITAVRMTTAAGDIAITRPDGLLASYTVPGQPERLVALKRRDVADLITEELRRMDADDIFERTVKTLLKQASPAGNKAPAKPARKRATAGTSQS
jgi:glucose-6-phosphate dehydrogenase assembly protein OpcA